MRKCLDRVAHHPLVLVFEQVEHDTSRLLVCGQVPERPHGRGDERGELVVATAVFVDCVEQRDARPLDALVGRREVRARNRGALAERGRRSRTVGNRIRRLRILRRARGRTAIGDELDELVEAARRGDLPERPDAVFLHARTWVGDALDERLERAVVAKDAQRGRRRHADLVDRVEQRHERGGEPAWVGNLGETHHSHRAGLRVIVFCKLEQELEAVFGHG